MVDEDRLNMQIRKFLKEAGVTSQREIEKAVLGLDGQEAAPAGRKYHATMTLRIAELDLEHTVVAELET